jgi:hypothetical protein
MAPASFDRHRLGSSSLLWAPGYPGHTRSHQFGAAALWDGPLVARQPVPWTPCPRPRDELDTVRSRGFRRFGARRTDCAGIARLRTGSLSRKSHPVRGSSSSLGQSIAAKIAAASR